METFDTGNDHFSGDTRQRNFGILQDMINYYKCLIVYIVNSYKT